MAEPLKAEPSLTDKLRRFSGGDRTIAEEVLCAVLPELHRLAVRALGHEYNASALSPMELINEVWIRSLHKGGWQIDNREHFYGIAALAMRHALMDFARGRAAQRRGLGNVPLPVDEDIAATGANDERIEEVVLVGMLMERLEKRDSETACVVDMHYFSGFTFEEIANIKGLTLRQVRYRWKCGCDRLKDGLLLREKTSRRNGASRH
jgi:RNA polymerase sigma factor (TIGR02999 family)